MYEIPEEALNELSPLFNRRAWAEMPPGAQQMFEFQRDGRRFIRWIVHPLTHAAGIHTALVNWHQRGIPVQGPIDAPFDVLVSASRSLYLQTPEGDVLALKTSLARAEGMFRDKLVQFNTLHAWGRTSRLISEVAEPALGRRLPVLREPVAIGGQHSASDSEDGFVLRNLEFNTSNPDRYFMPAFSVFDSRVGAAIATASGSDSPGDFWRTNLVKPTADTMAWLQAVGASHTSPHGQNILIEMDGAFRPTGRVVVRDLDFYWNQASLDAWMPNATPEQVRGLLDTKAYLGFSLPHGIPRGRLPTWFTSAHYEEWIRRYYRRFNKTFRRITRIQLPEGTPAQSIGGVFIPGPPSVNAPSHVWDNLGVLDSPEIQPSLRRWYKSLRNGSVQIRPIDDLPRLAQTRTAPSAVDQAPLSTSSRPAAPSPLSPPDPSESDPAIRRIIRALAEISRYPPDRAYDSNDPNVQSIHQATAELSRRGKWTTTLRTLLLRSHWPNVRRFLFRMIPRSGLQENQAVVLAMIETIPFEHALAFLDPTVLRPLREGRALESWQWDFFAALALRAAGNAQDESTWVTALRSTHQEMRLRGDYRTPGDAPVERMLAFFDHQTGTATRSTLWRNIIHPYAGNLMSRETFHLLSQTNGSQFVAGISGGCPSLPDVVSALSR